MKKHFSHDDQKEQHYHAIDCRYRHEDVEWKMLPQDISSGSAVKRVKIGFPFDIGKSMQMSKYKTKRGTNVYCAYVNDQSDMMFILTRLVKLYIEPKDTYTQKFRKVGKDNTYIMITQVTLSLEALEALNYFYAATFAAQDSSKDENLAIASFRYGAFSKKEEGAVLRIAELFSCLPGNVILSVQ